jgi:hypothetical protein
MRVNRWELRCKFVYEATHAIRAHTYVAGARVSLNLMIKRKNNLEWKNNL